MNMKALLRQRKVQCGIIGVFLILIIIIFLAATQMNKVKIDFKLNNNVIEYGTDEAYIDWKKGLSQTAVKSLSKSLILKKSD